jgi:hypothetical protein
MEKVYMEELHFVWLLPLISRSSRALNLFPNLKKYLAGKRKYIHY